MVFSAAEVETEGCQVRRRGQWRVLCSAVWLHEVSGVFYAQLNGYTRMSVAGLQLSCLVTWGWQWRIFCSAFQIHEDGSGGFSAKLFDYTRITVADVQRCFVFHLKFQAQTPSRPSLFWDLTRRWLVIDFWDSLSGRFLRSFNSLLMAVLTETCCWLYNK